MLQAMYAAALAGLSMTLPPLMAIAAPADAPAGDPSDGAAVEANGWILLVKRDDFQLYYRLPVQRSPGRWPRVWVRREFPAFEPMEGAASETMLETVNCDDGRFTIESWTRYPRNNLAGPGAPTAPADGWETSSDGPLRQLRLLACGGHFAIPASAREGPASLVGAGEFKCGEYRSHRQFKQDAQVEADVTWIFGWISAYNAYAHPRNDAPTADLDFNFVRQWLDAYCQSHPMNNLATASDALIAELKARRP